MAGPWRQRRTTPSPGLSATTRRRPPASGGPGPAPAKVIWGGDKCPGGTLSRILRPRRQQFRPGVFFRQAGIGHVEVTRHSPHRCHPGTGPPGRPGDARPRAHQRASPRRHGLRHPPRSTAALRAGTPPPAPWTGHRTSRRRCAGWRKPRSR